MSTFWWEKAQQPVIELEGLKYQVKAVWSVVMTVMSVILDAVYQKIKKEEKEGGKKRGGGGISWYYQL